MEKLHKLQENKRILVIFMLVSQGALHSGQLVENCNTSPSKFSRGYSPSAIGFNIAESSISSCVNTPTS